MIERKKIVFLAIPIVAFLVLVLLFSGFLNFGAFQIAPVTPSSSFVVPVTIKTYGNAWSGELAFGLWNFNSSNGATGGYLVVMNTTGELEYLRQTGDLSYGVVKNIQQNTLMFQGEPILGGSNTAPLQPVHFWNYVTNETVDFPNVIGHHDIEYDPINNTFLTMLDHVEVVDNASVLFDKIVQYDADGNVLWTWDTQDHIPLSETDPFNVTAIYDGTTVEDFTHTNAIDWDYNNSIIYLNIRHTNTFYKIDQNTGNIIWGAGQFGNFTLLDANGTQVPSLWYHSHSTYQVAPDVFTMFDNDFDNVTNPNDCHSRMIEVTLNEKNMTAWISWNWTAPTSYWTPFFGKNDPLPNGDRIGVFGSQTHQFPQNKPWNFSDTGAILVEVDPLGNVVRTYTFPSGWAIYRIEELKYPTIPAPPTPVPTSTPTLYPTPTQTLNPTQEPTQSPTLNPTPTQPYSSVLLPTPSSTLPPTPSPIPSLSEQPTATPGNPKAYRITSTQLVALSVAIIIIVIIGIAYLFRKKR